MVILSQSEWVKSFSQPVLHPGIILISEGFTVSTANDYFYSIPHVKALRRDFFDFIHIHCKAIVAACKTSRWKQVQYHRYAVLDLISAIVCHDDRLPVTAFQIDDISERNDCSDSIYSLDDEIRLALLINAVIFINDLREI